MIVAIGLAILWVLVLVFLAGIYVGLCLSEDDYCGKYCSHALEVAEKAAEP